MSYPGGYAISALLGGRPWASLVKYHVCSGWVLGGTSLVLGQWVYGAKFDFDSARSTRVPDRPGPSYGKMDSSEF